MDEYIATEYRWQVQQGPFPPEEERLFVVVGPEGMAVHYDAVPVSKQPLTVEWGGYIKPYETFQTLARHDPLCEI